MPTPLRTLSSVTLTYVRMALVYLVAGPVLLLFSAAGLLSANRDAFFVMELYGFVTMFVFGISYFFVPGIAYGKIECIRIARVQMVVINLGTIALTSGLSGDFTPAQTTPLMISGLILILASALMHTSNLWRTIRRGLKSHDSKVTSDIRV